MTTTAPTSRIGRVIRLHLVNPWATIGFPFVVLGVIFALTYIVWLLVAVGDENRANVSEGLQYNGASTWIFVYMFVVAVQAITATFPLALGFGSTRRNFAAGTAVTFGLLSLMWSVVFTILSVVETATDGWGVRGRMFSAIYFGGDSATAPERFVIFLCITLSAFFVGAAGAVVWVRWKAVGLTLFFLAIAGTVVGGIALVALGDAWGAVGDFVSTRGALGVALVLLVPTVVAAGVGFSMLRRATPRG